MSAVAKILVVANSGSKAKSNVDLRFFLEFDGTAEPTVDEEEAVAVEDDGEDNANEKNAEDGREGNDDKESM